MRVRVRLFALLRRFGPEEQVMEIPEDGTLSNVVGMLKLPEKIPLLKVVNGEQQSQ